MVAWKSEQRIAWGWAGTTSQDKKGVWNLSTAEVMNFRVFRCRDR